jgi:acetyl esterase/lipase
MPSFQRTIFKTITKIMSARMNSISSLPKLRAFMDMGPPIPSFSKSLTIKTDLIDNIPVEWIIPQQTFSNSVILYLHGGGWTLGWKDSHRSLVAHICQSASSQALAVDYRLAPEYPFPAALEDCLAAYKWLLSDGTSPKQIVIAGDSAGANLALATMMSLRDTGDPLPAAAVCISPMTDLAGTGDTFYSKKDALLTSRFALTLAHYYIGNQDPHNPLISPHYGCLDGLPPLLIHVGEDEILLSDSIRLADKARSAGVDVNLKVWPKMWHVWHTFVPYLPEAKQAVNEIGLFIRKYLKIAGNT